jgi:glycosyltransferase involved in cell wall biosynthesis
MRILQVVTLISPDAAYGGPVRVAVNQSAALRDRGHDVVIAAATRGYEQLPTSVGDVPVQAFWAKTTMPGIGFAGIRGAGMTRWLGNHASEFDVVHVHLARDFVTLPAARACIQRRIPIVAQPHGMIDFSSKLLAKPLDRFWTRPVLRAASTVFYLTPREARDLREVAGDVRLLELNNGVPPAAPRHASKARKQPEVLFLARLHPRKRADMFVEMAHRLIENGSNADFALVGPDDGTKYKVDDLIAKYRLQSRVRYEGALAPDRAVDRMLRASVYVLPAIDEPYPMSVLEAMSTGLPVVVTDTCGLAPLIEETHSGIVVGPDLDSLTDAVQRILVTPGLLDTMGENARRTVLDRLGMSSVAEILEQTYQRAVRSPL